MPIHISKILEPYVFEKESLNFLFCASFIERIVSGILDEIAAIKKAEINKLTPKKLEISSTTSTRL